MCTILLSAHSFSVPSVRVPTYEVGAYVIAVGAVSVTSIWTKEDFGEYEVFVECA